jgi:hypothetical protein
MPHARHGLDVLASAGDPWPAAEGEVGSVSL